MMVVLLEVSLSDRLDSWSWNIGDDGEFIVVVTTRWIDKKIFPCVDW